MGMGKLNLETQVKIEMEKQLQWLGGRIADTHLVGGAGEARYERT